MEQLKVRATRDQLNDFKESILWADICAELEFWKKGFEQEMQSIVDDAATTNPSTASVLLHMGDLNGRAKAVDYMLSIPDILLSALEVNKDVRHEQTD